MQSIAGRGSQPVCLHKKERSIHIMIVISNSTPELEGNSACCRYPEPKQFIAAQGEI